MLVLKIINFLNVSFNNGNVSNILQKWLLLHKLDTQLLCIQYNTYKVTF